MKSLDVDATWPMARFWIEQACKRGPGGINAEGLKAQCKAEVAQLFVVMRDGECIAGVVTCVVTEITGRKVMEWLAVGGEDMRAWAGFEQTVLDAAREHGCVAARSYSRPGMGRVLKARGYAPTGVILERELV